MQKWIKSNRESINEPNSALIKVFELLCKKTKYDLLRVLVRKYALFD